MKSPKFHVLLCLSLLLITYTPGMAADWSTVSRIHLGGEGGWDYLTIDPATDRLFVSHAKQVVVVDLKSNSVIGSIPANGVHGIALAADLNRGFISNGAGNNVTVFDLATLKVLTTLPAGKNPDAICYDPATHRVFAFNGKSGTATVIDATKATVLGEIPLEGKPEFAAVDGHGAVFDALEDKSQILKIDAATMAVVARWSLPEESSPSGVAIDAEHGRLFVGCGNKTMAILDTASGKIITTLPIGEGVDACVYDPVGKRAFASCGDGTMTVVKQGDDDSYTVAVKVTTEPRARTMAFDPKTSTAYLPIAKFGPAPVTYSRPAEARPSVLPDSLELLVVRANP